MSKIKILPEILSNKIAAGEVVERPASVVKELVENALDAGGTRIMVDIEKGGRSLIRIADNGCGMGRDDALLALERYATSKIYSDQDLFRIHTLGFRGEALPSIASVSRFCLISREGSSDIGTEILVEGGKIKNVSETGAPVGTMVTIKQLFFNTPARRKFLKTIATEMGHIGDLVASIALGHPEVQFRLTHNDKVAKDWPSASTPLDRMVDVLGGDLKNSLHPIEFQSDAVSIRGWISSPRASRSTSRGLFIYVNGRFVRDRTVQHALFEGYSQRLVKGQFPLAAVFINVPFDEVDVNVHPTKSEIRFARQREVHAAVQRAVDQTLIAVDRPGWGRGGSGKIFETPDSGTQNRVAETGVQEFGMRNSEWGRREAEVGDQRSEVGGRRGRRSEFGTDWELRDAESEKGRPRPATRDPQPTTHHPQSDTRNLQLDTRPAQNDIWPKKRFASMRILGQFHATYIVCEAEEGLILIDQHAAHERILFEQFSGRATQAPKTAQRLLIPESIELGYREAGVLERIGPDLAQLGMEIEPFGGNTFVVKSVPSLLAAREVKPLVVEIVEKAVEAGTAPDLSQMLDECRMIMACHGAIRAGQVLSGPQMSALLAQIDDCRNPSHCPHGRPTWIRWELSTLEKSFKRIV